MKPRAEMKRLAVFNLVWAGITVASDITFILLYIKMSRLQWSQLFRTEPIHHSLMTAFGSFTFGLFPVFAAFLIRNAWVIFKNLDKIPD
jgi:hypothetical protein